MQNLIDLGVYEERYIKGKDNNGNKIQVSEVRVVKEIDEEVDEKEWKESGKMGGQPAATDAVAERMGALIGHLRNNIAPQPTTWNADWVA